MERRIISLRHPSESDEDSAGGGEVWQPRPLLRVDVETGAVTMVCEQVSTTSWRISPDGTEVAFFNWVGGLQGRQVNQFHLCTAELSAPFSRRVVADSVCDPGYPDELFESALSWSPDSRYLAYYLSDAVGCVAANGSSAPLLLRSETDSKPDLRTPPIWNGDGRGVYAIFEGDILHFAIPGGDKTVLETDLKQQSWLASGRFGPDMALTEQGQVWIRHRDGTACIDLDQKRATEHLPPLPEAEETLVSNELSTAFCKSGRSILKVCLKSGDDSELCSYGYPSEKISYGGTKTLSWFFPSDKECKGKIILPPDYTAGRRYPVIMELYAGGSSGEGRITDPQLLAARGYVVFLPELPLASNSFNPMLEIPKAVSAARDRIVALGVADPDRIGVMGHSYGCYTVLSLLVQSDQYKAGVVSNGSISLLHCFESASSWAESGQGRMGGSIWEKRRNYVENSPQLYFDRISAPVLFINGLEDLWGDGMLLAGYASLKRLNKPAEYRGYPGCGHGPRGWPRECQKDLCQTLFRWFGEYL